MTTATTDDATALTPDPRQLRDDLHVLRRVSRHKSQAAPSVARNLDMVRRIARHWIPAGHARRAAADGMASEEQRWETLLACAAPEPSVEQSYAAVIAYALGVKDLVQALHDDIRHALATRIADRLRSQIAAGIYTPGARLPGVKVLASTVCSDYALVGEALRILVAEGMVLVTSGRAEVLPAAARLLPRPAPTAHHDERAFRFSRDTIVATCRGAHEQWRCRGPASEELLHGRWQDLCSMVGQLLATARIPAPDAAQQRAALARAAWLASAPLPDTPWLQQWHTACLAKALADVLPLLPKDPR